MGVNRHPFVKDKWDERAYFLVQDVLYEGMDDGHVSVNAGISDLAILAFIRATCSRPGALAKDWFVLRCRRRGPLKDLSQLCMIASYLGIIWQYLGCNTQ